MPYPHVPAPSAQRRPTAIGFVRIDISAHHAPRHAGEIQRHARESGYRYLYTVRPPIDEPNPLTYVRALATELRAEVIIAFDLGQVDDRPALICDLGYRLETVCPPTIWAASTPIARAEGQRV
ncbi:hypothetical protein NLM24_07965 [Nocardia zapadnayensis]|uniref:hypothetical protein n=1 Tax=Nocardia rhamnosiphila TaxID=426716 RepID=UPI002247C44C|nr:hypothetical protein [Nocardia zapadnayensis]MCX0270640.1 hypothetical protein [Nocardia zapadnayensis]